jgi:hypothetical protein
MDEYMNERMVRWLDRWAQSKDDLMFVDTFEANLNNNKIDGSCFNFKMLAIMMPPPPPKKKKMWQAFTHTILSI